MNPLSPLPPVPEADAFRAETRATRSSPSTQAALKALGALRTEPRAARDSQSEDAEEAPPLPDSLRERWEEIYGRAPAAPEPNWSLGAWFAAKLQALSAAKLWAGAGLAGAAAAVALLMLPAGTEVPVSGDSAAAAAVLLRGGGEAAAGKTAPGAPVLVRAESEAAAADVLAALREAFPHRHIAWLSPDTAAAADSAVVLDLKTGTARGTDGAEQPLEAGAPSAVMAVEEADERAAPPPEE